MPDTKHADLFELFNEIGIIEQLSRAFLEAQLPKGLIAPHFTVLNHLCRLGDGRAPIDIARAFQVPKTTLTHTLQGLESHGLIEMRPNPNDGRSKLVYLSDAGRALRNNTVGAMAPEFERLGEGFDVGKLYDILPTLRDLRVYLDDDKNRAAARSD